LISPDGSTLSAANPWGPECNTYIDAFTLPQTGTYVFDFVPLGSNTGDGTFTFYSVPANNTYSTSPTNAGATVAETTTTPGQNAVITFHGSAGEGISVDTSNWSGALAGRCPVGYSLSSPSGTVISGGPTWGPECGGFIDKLVLTSSGTYTFTLDPIGDDVGGVNLTFYQVPPDAQFTVAPTAKGASVTAANSVPGQNADVGFYANAGDTLNVATSNWTGALGGRCPTAIAVIAPNGSDVISEGVFGPECSTALTDVSLPTSGTYVLLLDPIGDDVGGTTFALSANESTSPGETQGGGNPFELQCVVCGGDPVNTATGDYFEASTDIAIPGRGPGLAMTRTYSSLAANSGATSALGHGWAWNYGMSLVISPSTGGATITNANGSQTSFVANGSGGYTPPSRVLATLVGNANGTYTYTARAQTVYTFNASGQLTQIADLDGDATTLAYNAAAQLTSATDGAGRALKFAYNATDELSSVTDPDGRTVAYAYSPAGDLTQVTNVRGGETLYTYSSVHLMLTRQDPNGNVVMTNTYNGQGQTLTQTDALHRETTFAYTGSDPLGVTTTQVTSPSGNVTAYSYEGGLLTSLTQAAGTSNAGTYDYTYDPATDGTTSVSDPDGHIATATYDASGNQTSDTNADGNTTKSVFNTLDEPTSITDATGVATTYVYNSTGNLTSVSRPLTSNKTTQTTTYTYGSATHPGDVTAITDPDGNTTKLTYDTDGDLASSTDPIGDQTTYSDACSGTVAAGCYSNVGLLYSEVSPRGNVSGATASNFTTSYTHNAAGQPITTKNPLGQTTTDGYDADGNSTRSTDAVGNATGYTYDAANELTKTTRPDATTLTRTYDGDGNLLTQTNGAGHTTTYAYDARDRLTSITDPLNRVTTLGYDATGNLSTVKDAEGRTTTNSFDAANQLAGVSYSDKITPNVTYKYNADGEQTSMTDGTGTTSYAYDSLDRLTGQTNGYGQVVTYAYDLDGNQTGVGYPNAKTVTRTFTKADQLATVEDWLGNTTSFAYNADGDPATATFPSATGDVDSYTNNSADELTSTVMKHATTTLASLTDTRNPDGQLASEAQTGLPGAASISYTYNKLSQVTAAATNAYAYNTADDPTELESATGYTYDNAEELTKSPTASYTYDALGERTAATPASGTSAAYTYNQPGELSADKPSTGASYTYAYDGNGLRASKTTGATTGHFAYNLTTATTLVLTDSNNYYIYGPGDLPIEQITTAGTVTYLHHDQLGTTRLITSSAGATVGTFSYSAYGKPTGSTGTATTPLGYAGQYTDAETGFQYDNARYYDPATAQFLTVDPLKALSIENYAYADDSPVNATDPSGRFAELEGGDGGFADLPAYGVTPGDPSGSASADDGSTDPEEGDSTSGSGAADSGAVDCASPDPLQSPATEEGGGAASRRATNDGDEMGTGNLGRNRGNDYARYLARKYGLTDAQQREFHDEISGQNYDRATLDEIAQEIGGGD
jgi:RHS repeat-associated protein